MTQREKHWAGGGAELVYWLYKRNRPSISYGQILALKKAEGESTAWIKTQLLAAAKNGFISAPRNIDDRTSPWVLQKVPMPQNGIFQVHTENGFKLYDSDPLERGGKDSMPESVSTDIMDRLDKQRDRIKALAESLGHCQNQIKELMEDIVRLDQRIDNLEPIEEV